MVEGVGGEECNGEFSTSSNKPHQKKTVVYEANLEYVQ